MGDLDVWWASEKKDPRLIGILDGADGLPAKVDALGVEVKRSAENTDRALDAAASRIAKDVDEAVAKRVNTVGAEVLTRTDEVLARLEGSRTAVEARLDAVASEVGGRRGSDLVEGRRGRLLPRRASRASLRR